MQRTSSLEAAAVIEAILKGNANEVLTTLYKDYQGEFTRWAANRFDGISSEFMDIFQDSVIVFYEHVLNRKVTSLNCKLKTYLFAIAYKKLQKASYKMKRVDRKDEVDDALQQERVVLQFEWDDEDREKMDFLNKAMEKLTPQCKELLTRAIYHQQNIETIAKDMNYADKPTASAAKARCLRSLKEFVQSFYQGS